MPSRSFNFFSRRDCHEQFQFSFIFLWSMAVLQAQVVLVKASMKLLIFTSIARIFIFSFNFTKNTTMPARSFQVKQITTSTYSPPTTTLSPSSGWVSPSTIFTLTPSGATSTSYAKGTYGSMEKNDMDFSGGTSGNDVTTLTNWTDAAVANCYNHIITWPQTNSWSNYSSTNTASGYNKLGCIMYDNSASASDTSYWTLPEYVPSGNIWYYVGFEVQPQAESSSQCYYVGLQDVTGSIYGIDINVATRSRLLWFGKFLEDDWGILNE